MLINYIVNIIILTYGGTNGIRTHHPLLARQVLFQMSYSPIYFSLLFTLKKKSLLFTLKKKDHISEKEKVNHIKKGRGIMSD